MSAQVTDLGERLPQVVVQTPNAVHVIPVSILRDVIAGRDSPSILTGPVLRRIVEEWLELTGPSRG